MRHVDMANDAHRDPGFLALNPAGRVPALGLPDRTCIGETAAILILLSELHPESGVAPAPGEADRPAFLFWLNVMATAGYVTSSRVGHPERFAREDGAIAQVKAQADRDLNAFFNLMDEAISGAPFFLSYGPTCLDHYVAMLAEWSSDRDALLATRPSLRALCNAVRRDPAYANAMKAHAKPERNAAE